MKSVFGVISVILLSSVVAGQEATEQQPDPIEKVRATYREVFATREKAKAEIEQLKEHLKLSPGEAKRPETKEKVLALQKAAKAPLDPFVAVFRDVDWSKFDATNDKALLLDGLSTVALDSANGEKSISASRLFLQLFPNDRLAPIARARWLPLTLISLDRDDEAVKELRTAFEQSKDQVKAKAAMLLGDMESIRGNFEGAKRAFAEVSAGGVKAMTEKAAIKAAVIGAPAAALDGKQWIGGAAVPPAELKGKVVLLGFFATYAPSGRIATGNWNRIRDQHQEAGLICIGVTKPSPHGYLPPDAEHTDTGGTSRQGMSAEQFVEHITQYHTNTKMHYPIVVADEAAFTSHGVMRVPTSVLLDREGRITLVLPDLDDEDVLLCAIRRHLKKK